MTTQLDSWRDTATTRAIVDFVEDVTSGADAVPPAERIAVFDNDGTLWTEKPMPTQLHFIVQKWVAAAKAKPEIADIQPYKAAVSGDLSWLGGAIDKHYAGADSELKQMIGALLATSAGLSVDDYGREVAAFYGEAAHMTLGRPYSQVVFQPMVELLRYLEANEFTCYIVSGGDRDFMRPITFAYYGIPAERVIGSAVGLTFNSATNNVEYGTNFDFLDDGPEKPIRIWSRIGRRPILAAGNSNGDGPMLRYVQGHPRSLSLLVHHDDDTGRGDPAYDKGAEHVLDEAEASNFTIVSVRDDWSALFPDS